MHYKLGSYAALTKLGLSTGMQRVLMPAAIAGVASGGVGAYNNEDDRLGGALRGAAGGALLGGAAGLLHNGIANLTDDALVPINRNLQSKGVPVTPTQKLRPRPADPYGIERADQELAQLKKDLATVDEHENLKMQANLDWNGLLAKKKKNDLN